MALRVPGIPSRLLAPGFPDNEHLSGPGDTAQNPRTAHLRRGLALPLPDQAEQRRAPQLGHRLCTSGLSLSHYITSCDLREGRTEAHLVPKEDGIGSAMSPQIHMLNP